MQELQPYNHFVIWETIYQQGKPKKLPFNPVTRTPASCVDPDTWETLSQALTALKAGTFEGVGFVFINDDQLTGIDIDDCVLHNQLTTNASDLVTEFWSYTELSPSKTRGRIQVSCKSSGSDCARDGADIVCLLNFKLRITVENSNKQLGSMRKSWHFENSL